MSLTEKRLQGQIDEAVASGRHLLTVSGDYEIADTVLLPSDFTLILSDCYLRMADGVTAQMFANKGYRRGEENSVADADKNIRLLGVGRAVLDGGSYNGLSESTSNKNGFPHISQNNTLLFSNVAGFEIGNLQVINQRWWALNFLFCSSGHIHDIAFCADDRRRDENGNLVHGLLRSDYLGTYIKNADGIDLRAGCHDILIENITGFCEDDTIALTDLCGTTEKLYAVKDAGHDIYNIVIRNIRACSYCSIVRLLNQAPGASLYNILIDGVFDSSLGSPHLDRGIHGVRVGDGHSYGSSEMPASSVRNISISNVYSRATYAVHLAGYMEEPALYNIRAFDGCMGEIEDCRENRA